MITLISVQGSRGEGGSRCIQRELGATFYGFLPSLVSLPPFCIPTFLYSVIGLLNECCDFAELPFEPSSLLLFSRMALMRNE